ncbi:MAG TPA: STAS domain-containing protein [Bryobacteraceae bacterium]|nr:STAS domain-containing protein [Bryobacteraceae bacterium]
MDPMSDSLSHIHLELHGDPVQRDEFIRLYLHRRLAPQLAEEFENHYLGCDQCYTELRATELLIHALGEPVLERQRVNDVTVLRFTATSELLAASLELNELSKAIRTQSDTKVLIDLSKVSRIDSTGLGVLMNCYCHAVKNSGALKLLNPDAPVKKVLQITKIDKIVPTFEDENAAIASFQT